MNTVGPGERGERPLVILGATASGKSTLALAVAAAVDGVELVSVDSMQVYRGMDIGTATPIAAERAAVRHHLIDLVEPSEGFTVGAFQRHAKTALADIRERGATPVLVGGTGLYLRALVDDLELPGRFPDVAAELELEADTEALHRRLVELDPVGAERMEPNNRRRILRALEVSIGSGRAFSSFGPGLENYSPTPFVQVAIRWPRDVINARIEARYQQQMDDGFLDEVERLAAIGLSRTAAQALGYRELLAHLEGDGSLDEALAIAIHRTCRFARRQERWFRRDPRIRWVDGPSSAEELIGIWDEVRANPAA